MKNWQRYPFFLVLLPLFVVVHLEKELHNLIHYHFLYGRLVVLFALPFLFTLLFYVFFRQWSKAALFSGVVCLFVYFLGDVKNALNEWQPGTLIGKYSFLFLASGLVLFFIFRWIKRTTRSLAPVYSFLHVLLVLSIAVDLFVMIRLPHQGHYRMRQTDLGEMPGSLPDSLRPDIYYIIFDAYTSSAVLNTEFGYDNRHQEAALREKGFQVFPQSRSNYNYTAFSLSSVFHLNYMDNVDTTHKIEDRTYLQALRTVEKNPWIPFLKKQGYQIYNHSLFDFEDHPTTRTESDKWGVRELFDQYNIFFKFVRDLNHKLPAPLTRPVMNDAFFVNKKENRDEYDKGVWEDLCQTHRAPGPAPKFVYAHFLTPHPPFFVDSLGKNLSTETTDIRKGYVHQVARVNRWMLSLADTLTQGSGRPKVVIFQGDHGYSTLTEPAAKKAHMFPNWQAWYVSDGNYREIPDSLTNVNTFRILLRGWFKKEIPILHNEFYFIK